MSQDKLREALRGMLGLFTPNGYLFASGERQIETVAKAREAYAAALAQPAPSAERCDAGLEKPGFKLVPIEPTAAMRRAGGLAINDDEDVVSVTGAEAVAAWEAMVAAYPTTPAPKPEPDGWVCVGPDGQVFWSTATEDKEESLGQIGGPLKGWTCRPVVVLRGEK